MKKLSNFQIASLAILSCILWSTAFAGIKSGLQYYKPIPFAGIRFMLSGLLLVPFWIYKKKSLKRVIKNWKLIITVSLFQTFILYALVFWALTYISGAITAIIVGSSPLTTALTTHIVTKQDKISRYKFLTIIIGITGITVITLSNSQVDHVGAHYLFGVILLLLSSVASAIGNILASNKKNVINPIALNSLQMFLGGLMLFIIAIPTSGIPKLPTVPVFYFALLWLSFISATAFSIWFMLLKTQNVKVSDLNIWKFVIPVFGCIFSWILIPGESPEVITIMGMLIAAGSILMYNFNSKNIIK